MSEQIDPIAVCFSNEINAVIDKYRGQGIAVGEVIGCFEVAKYRLITEAIEDSDDAD